MDLSRLFDRSGPACCTRPSAVLARVGPAGGSCHYARGRWAAYIWARTNLASSAEITHLVYKRHAMSDQSRQLSEGESRHSARK